LDFFKLDIDTISKGFVCCSKPTRVFKEQLLKETTRLLNPMIYVQSFYQQNSWQPLDDNPCSQYFTGQQHVYAVWAADFETPACKMSFADGAQKK
jgi:hypothetical protein